MTAKPLYDVVVRNGTLIDGSGCPAYAADVALQGDRIAEIGDLRDSHGRHEVDAKGLIVAPGFIDVHTHDDAVLIERPQMTPKLTQGVTTVIAGNCGISAAPYNDEPIDLLRLVFKSTRCMAASFESYLQKIEAAGPAVNAAFLTGHTTLRMQVMGADLQRPATPSEAQAMRDLLVGCLEQGSLGLSTGLFYPPARASSTAEVIEVARPLSEYDGIYVTHMRDEADGIVDSMRESLHISRTVGVPIVISHHKCMGQKNRGRSVETLALLMEARQYQEVAWDVYPYTAGSSILTEDLVSQSARTVITWSEPHPELCGRDLTHAAETLGCRPLEAVAQLQPAGALYFMMDETDVDRILCSPGAMIGSDGLPADQHPHPRLWGTFPRVFARYVRQRSLLSVEEAVYRMTGSSARRFGLCNRGVIKVGNYADLCIFDSQSITDSATYEQPQSPAVGIHCVVVNGKIALEHGASTATRAGRVLRRLD